MYLKNLLITQICFLSFTLFAQNPYYLGVKTGIAFHDEYRLSNNMQDSEKHETTSPFLLEVNAGFEFHKNIRLEAIVSYRSANETSWSLGQTRGESQLSSLNIMSSAFIEKEFLKFKPYLGLGAGLTRNTLDDYYYYQNGKKTEFLEGDTTYQFAWQLSLGTAYRYSDQLSFEGFFRYTDIGKIASGKKVRNYPQNTSYTLDTIYKSKKTIAVKDIGLGARYYL